MATTVSFKQPCPSCEHPVPIRDPKLIGRKIDCPKCKYRFVVEEPPADAGDDEDKPKDKKGETGVTTKKKGDDSAVTSKKANGKSAPAKKPTRRRDEDDGDEIDDSAPKKKKGGMSPMLLVGIGIGAIGLIGIIVFLVVALSGGDDKPKTKPVGPAADTAPPPEEKKEENAGGKPAVAGDAGDLVALTNLYVPNSTEVVRHAYMDKLMSSDLGDAAFSVRDTQAASFSKDAFAAKWGFRLEDVACHIQSQSLKEDWIFNVIRTKVPIDFEKLKGSLGLKKGPKSPVGDKEYFTITSELDPFSRFWFADLYMYTAPTRNKPLGVYKADQQTLIVAELDPLEHFLKHKPEVVKPVELPAAGNNNPAPPGEGPAAPPGGMRGGPTPPGGMMGGSAPQPGGISAPGGMRGGPMAPPGGMSGMPPGGMSGMPPGGMAGMQGGQPAGPSESWMTLKPDLKKMLDRLEEKPAILSIAMVGDAFVKVLDKSPENLGVDLSGKLPEDTKAGGKSVGAAIYAAKLDRLTITIGADAPQEENAKNAETKINEQLLPGVTALMQLIYGLKVTQFSGQQGGMMGMGGMAGMSGMPPGGMSGMPPGGMSGMPPGGMRGGPVPPGGMSGMPPGGMSGMPPSGMRGGPIPPGGMSGMPPGGAGGKFPPGEGPVPPGGFQGGQPGENGQQQPAPSTVGVSRDVSLLLLSLDLAWNEKLRNEITADTREWLMLRRATTEMSISRPRVHELAAAIQAYTEKHHAFPRGAYDRVSNATRFNRPWEPTQRISWMAEVLRFLPQYVDEFGNNPGAYPLGIRPNLSWNEGPNLTASRMLVPQFLPQSSPEDQWRVPYPKLTFPVAATQFVGLAGIGLDAAEEGTPPARRGVFSYDHATNLAEITDGPAKTIAVVQVPPDFKTPWLAGGGSTVRGVPEKDSVRPFVCAEYQGKKGTYAIMASGEVRFVLEDIPDSLFQALVTVAGNEPVSKEELDKYAPLVPPPDGVELKVVVPPQGAKPPVEAPKPPPPAGLGDAADRARKANDLKQIGLAYHNCWSATNKAPAKVEDLEPYYEQNPKITAALKDGTYVFYYNVKPTDMVNGTSNTILGYEKDAPTKGGAVLFGDATVKPLTADEFAKTPKAGK